jgi:3',5'-cyclic AMP phosphodiesterase CpdA
VLCQDEPLRVLHISDLHLGYDPQWLYQGVYPWERLTDTLVGVDPEFLGTSGISRPPFELVAITGDISHDQGEEVYARLCAQLKSLGVPVLVLPGNHDEPDGFRRCFASVGASSDKASGEVVGNLSSQASGWVSGQASGEASGQAWGDLAGELGAEASLGAAVGGTVGRTGGEGICFRRKYSIGGWLILSLDSQVPGQIAGRLGDEQLHWLAMTLRDNPRQPTLIALHHAPVKVGTPWLDSQILEDSEAFLELVESFSQVRCVIFGHVHQEFDSRRDSGLRLLAAPAVSVQFQPGSPEFAVEPSPPGVRWIELCSDGRVQSEVWWLERCE